MIRFPSIGFGNRAQAATGSQSAYAELPVTLDGLANDETLQVIVSEHRWPEPEERVKRIRANYVLSA